MGRVTPSLEPGDTFDSMELLMRDARRYPLLSAAEEVALARRIERGDLVAKETLINSNILLVVSNIRRFEGCGVEKLDLVQGGMIGLIRAVEKFDYRKGFRFSTYATVWIRQALQKVIVKEGRTIHLPQDVARRAHRVARIEREMTARHGCRPSAAELAAAVGVAVEELEELRSHNHRVVSLDLPTGDNGRSVLADVLDVAGGLQVEDEVAENNAADVIQAAVKQLPYQERVAIEMRFGLGGNDPEPLTFDLIARMLGVTHQQAHRLLERALRTLRERQDVTALREAA